MKVLQFILNSIFVFSVIFIWLMLIYQFVLTVGGFLWKRKLSMEKFVFSEKELPSISVLVPARDEEKVIGKLIESLTKLKYPQEKIEIIVINDGSEDRTEEIVRFFSKKDERVKVINIPKEESGKGKSEALNRGLKEAKNEVVAVFDADNIPEEETLYKLCSALIKDKELAGCVGKFRAYNKDRNLLTRLINIESIAFQWIIQAGRWFFLKISFIPGTNFILWRSVLEKIGGWDRNALTEDSELTFRIYERGYRIKFLPLSTSWEQEPERLKTWIRQRTRWAVGNNYIISKYLKRIFTTRPNFTLMELLNLVYLYYIFVFAILFSDIIFILALLGAIKIPLIGPYAELWAFAFMLFLIEILIALSFEKEDSISNFLISIFAYFTYTKLWVFVVVRSLIIHYFSKKEKKWEKSERF
ncbi:MAG: glycosyltransferase [Candidatus Aminicenantia bacterium]